MSRFSKLKKKKIEDETQLMDLAEVESINHATKDVDKIRQMIKFEQSKQIAQYTSELNEEDLMIAKAYSLGLTDGEVLSEFSSYRQSELNRLKLNPSFVQEIESNKAINGFGNETIRNSKMGRLANILFEDILTNPMQIEEMSARDKIKLLTEINTAFNKKEEKNNTQVDITVIMKNRNIEEKRLKRGKDGNTYIDSEYPILDENGNIVGKY